MEPIYEQISHSICDRNRVSIYELLMAYYEVCIKKTFDPRHPATRNLPLIIGFNALHSASSLDKLIHSCVHTGSHLCLNYIQQLRPSEGTADEIHKALMVTMTELINWLHVANTRNPRTVDVGEVIHYRVLLEQLHLLMSMIEDEQELCDYIDGFLLSSFIAGVERGLPVVPTCEDLYKTVHFEIDPGTLFKTNRRHRGEARWVNGTSAESPMYLVERAYERRVDLRLMDKILKKIEAGKPLSRKYQDHLLRITNTPRPLIPAREQSDEDEDLQQAMEESLRISDEAVEPPSMQAMGQSQLRDMNYEQVRAHMARARRQERR